MALYGNLNDGVVENGIGTGINNDGDDNDPIEQTNS